MRELHESELKAEPEKQAAAREHELKMADLEKNPPSDKATAFDPSRNIRLVPPSKKRRLINILLILRKLFAYSLSSLICYTKQTVTDYIIKCLDMIN